MILNIVNFTANDLIAGEHHGPERTADYSFDPLRPRLPLKPDYQREFVASRVGWSKWRE
jgi:hypothetical protein